LLRWLAQLSLLRLKGYANSRTNRLSAHT
jgi:hypothetical protein